MSKKLIITHRCESWTINVRKRNIVKSIETGLLKNNKWQNQTEQKRAKKRDEGDKIG